MIGAILIIPLLLAVGSAVEFGLAYRDREALQGAADAAALAGGVQQPNDTDEIRRKRAEDLLLAQAEASHLPKPTYSIAVSEERVEISAQMTRTLAFKMLGDDIDISVKAVAGSSPGKSGLAIDAVMCLDITSSMPNYINQVKKRMYSFYDDISAALAARGLGEVEQVRLRTILFTDVLDAWIGREAFIESPFYTAPAGPPEFSDFIASRTVALVSGGGGDGPESGLECMYLAMQSRWLKPGDIIEATGKPATSVLPVIILWTDNDAKPLNDIKSRQSALNPTGMPDNDKDFAAVWNDPDVIDQTNKMFVLFSGTSWTPCGFSIEWHRSALSLPGAICGGSLEVAGKDMIGSIADAAAKVSKKATPPRLLK